MSTSTTLLAKRKRIWNTICKAAIDLCAVLVAAFFAALIFPSDTLDPLSLPMLYWLLGHMLVVGIAFAVCRLYRISYRTFGMFDLVRLAVAFVMVGALELVLLAIPTIRWYHGAIYCITFFFGAALIRIVLRMRFTLSMYRAHANDKERVVVVGAGAAGTMLIQELRSTDKASFLPVAAVDDDLSKQGMTIGGVKVCGTVDDITNVVKQYNATKVFVTMPSVPPKQTREVLKKCQKAGVHVQMLPGVYQFVTGKVSVAKMRDVEVEDLLGRDQIKVNINEIAGYITDKVVLVTGGGGSIGSELCRQIATQRPRQLIIFDIYENNAYDIEQELRSKHSALNLLVLIGSIRDKGKIEAVFAKYKPDIVFNAAAHKHVPLMETSPNEAVKNNVFGTLNVARAADKYGVSRFVQISTDKAVNPTNIMGATKRICEMIIQTVGKHSKTEFVAVRFGNVLGSNGSVIPLFKRQIAEGGPVTVTHKDIIRYFMTIPEAVSLVLQAGAYAKGGEIYVLDMGEQVRIYDLAENLIRLSGFEPGIDIEIRCTGLRPGEKLYEERLMDEEGMQKTANESISIGKPLDIDEDGFFHKLDELYEAAYRETDDMKDLVHELVPTYTIDRR